MKAIAFNQVMSSAAAINRSVAQGDDRWGHTLKAVRNMGRDAQRTNRADMALALYHASTAKDPDALMGKAFNAACNRAEEAFKASYLLAAINALPNMRVEPISPLVLPVGEAATFTPVHTVGELLGLLDTDEALLTSLLRQGANRAKAKGLASVAQWVAEHKEIMGRFSDNLAFLGKFARDEHSVKIGSVRYNAYALAQFESVKDAAMGIEVKGADLAQGLSAIAQFAADAAVDHRGLAEDADDTAIRFWVAEGGFHKRTDGSEGGYANAPDTLIRMPFYEVENLGQNPEEDEVVDAVKDAWLATQQVGVTFAAFARTLDTMLGDHATYRLRDGSIGDINDVFAAADDRLAARRTAQQAKMDARAMAALRDKAEALEAALDGLNAAQKAQARKMAAAIIEDLKSATERAKALRLAQGGAK